jgi:hypothetical protein
MARKWSGYQGRYIVELETSHFAQRQENLGEGNSVSARLHHGFKNFSIGDRQVTVLASGRSPFTNA